MTSRRCFSAGRAFPVSPRLSAAGLAAALAGALALGQARATVDGYPIAKLQLAGSAARAGEVMDGVPESTTLAAVRWDFVFIAWYTAVFVAVALRLAPQARRPVWLPRLSRHAAALAAVGAAADITENIAMLTGIGGGADTAWQAARAAALVKFVAFGLSLTYTGSVLVSVLLSPPPSAPTKRSR